VVKILVTGADGQLGCELRELAPALSSEAEWEFTDVGELDIVDRQMSSRFLLMHQPDILINCAAYTAVDKAESEPELAKGINAEGAANLARACRNISARMIHISTDFVFNGKQTTPYNEEDKADPLSEYGRSKLEGEQAVLKESARGVILRTSWLYSSYGSNFVKTMLRLAKEHDEINVVDDQIGSPTWAQDLAAAILQMIPRLKNEAPVIYQYANAGTASWYDFAHAVVEMSGLECRIIPIPTSAYPTPAPRPPYSKISTARIREDFDLTIPHWRDSLKTCLEQIRSQETQS